MYLRNASLAFFRNKYNSYQQISSLFSLKNKCETKPWRYFGVTVVTPLNAIENTIAIRYYSSKKENTVESEGDLRLNLETIRKLERLALVDFGNEAGVKRLEEAVKFASLILEVNTENVKPMYTVLEDRTIELRPDLVEETNREPILKCAVITEEHYFVAPPANKPY